QAPLFPQIAGTSRSSIRPMKASSVLIWNVWPWATRRQAVSPLSKGYLVIMECSTIFITNSLGSGNSRDCGGAAGAQIEAADIRVALDFRQRTVSEQAAVMQHRDRRLELPHEGHVVLDDDYRDAL